LAWLGVVAILGFGFGSTAPAQSVHDTSASTIKAVPGTQVVDSKGVVVGNIVQQNMVERQVTGGLWVTFSVGVPGIAVAIAPSLANLTNPLYTPSNCSGIPYLSVLPLPTTSFAFSPTASNFGNFFPSATLYFAGASVQSLPITSELTTDGCTQVTPVLTQLVGPLTSVNLSFAPPFSVR
jgi:hypothetical protein